MKTLGFTVPVLSVILLASGCATVYNPPRTQKQVIEETVNATKMEIYSSAIQVFRRAGLKTAFADLEEGRVSTRPKTMALNGGDCDCGGARGTSFSPDKGTTTDVSYLVIARDGSFSLRCHIHGQYVSSDSSMVKRFECVSTGKLEKDMIRKIKDAVSENSAE
jgi:hypothetical protein